MAGVIGKNRKVRVADPGPDVLDVLACAGFVDSVIGDKDRALVCSLCIYLFPYFAFTPRVISTGNMKH